MHLTDPLLRTWCALLTVAIPREAGEGDRGDVPGWVMVTIMSAGLVVAILAFARGAVADLVQQAFADVTSAGGAGAG